MRDMVKVSSPRQAEQYRAPQARMSRSQINLGHSHKTSFDAGVLVPYVIQEVVPGDTFTCKTTIFGRVFSPLNAPIMDDIEWSLDYFYVPKRLIWEHWTDFLGEHDAAGAQDTTYTIPTVTTGHTVPASTDDLLSYMGVPRGLQTAAENISVLPLRAYTLIYDEWYRDQNLIDSEGISVGDGPDTVGAYPIKKSAKKHDYFTSALPYLQKGTAQETGLTGQIDVQHDAADNIDITAYSTVNSGYREFTTSGAVLEANSGAGSGSAKLYVDLADGGFTINALREAAAIQRLLEKDARAGTRHPEIIRAHFGVDVPDYRTQRPEYLGGGTGYINASPVPNTSPVDSVNAPGGADVNAGELAGTAAGTLTASWAKSFVEHGYIIGILRARGAVSYSQGLDRMWSRSTKYDFLWPELAMLGEQPIYNKELWLQDDATDDDVFGYQERYADYRFKKSLVTGQFDPNHTTSLDFWHLSEEFGSQPSLNQTFIEDATPMSRVTVVDSQHDFIVDGRIDLKVARILPVRPVPTLMPARF